MSQSNVLRSTAFLTLSGIAAKTVDFIFRAYYSRKLGSEGLGLFSLCFAVHAIMLNIASGGFGVAVSQIVSDRLSRREFSEVKAAMKLALCIVGVLGICMIFVTTVFSNRIATSFLKEPRCAKSLVYLSPSILFMSISYCLKGYFYASRRIAPPASSEFLEQAVKIISITALLAKMLPQGVEEGCAAVFLGISIGEFSSCLYLSIIYSFDIGRLKCGNVSKMRHLAPTMLKIALPVAISSLFGSLIRTQEQVMTVDGLKRSGMSHMESLKLYGSIYGMAIPFLMFPLSLLSSCFTMLVPEISRAHALKNSVRLKTLVSRIYRFCSFSGFLVMCTMFTFSEAFSEMLYGGEVEQVFIRVLTVIVPMAFMDSVSCGILNGMGRQRTMLIYSLSDSIGRLAVIYLLVPIFGMKGFLFIIILSNIFTSTLTSRKVCEITRVRFGWADRVLKHVFCAFLAGAIAFCLNLQNAKTAEEIVFGVLISAGLYVFSEILISPAVRNDFSWLRNRMFFNT